jgi:hypothetical protein
MLHQARRDPKSATEVVQASARRPAVQALRHPLFEEGAIVDGGLFFKSAQALGIAAARRARLHQASGFLINGGGLALGF